MKYTDLAKLQKEELDKKLNDLRTELMKLNAQVAIGTTPKSTKQIREIRRTIAKFETLRMQQFHDKMDKIESEVHKHTVKKRRYTHS